jgi:preprotein translocase subunit SecA
MKKSKFDISGKLREMRSTELNLEPAKKLLAQINQIDLSEKDDQFLRNMSADLKSRAMKGEKPEEMLTEAFALAREAAARTVGMRPFDVQVLAGIALHYGALVEMQTGEGKTLAATAPVYLNSLYGKGIHVLTFNDYLAKRDAL